MEKNPNIDYMGPMPPTVEESKEKPKKQGLLDSLFFWKKKTPTNPEKSQMETSPHIVYMGPPVIPDLPKSEEQSKVTKPPMPPTTSKKKKKDS